jgi:lysophospholipase L1-like esterase
LADGLVALAVLLLPWVWLLDRVVVRLGPAKLSLSWGAKPILFLVVAVGLRLAAGSWARRRGVPPGGALTHPLVGPVLASVFGLFALVWIWEWRLTARGYTSDLPGIVIVGEDTPAQLKSKYHYQDPELLWRWRPGVMFNGRPVNSQGFLEREFTPDKPAGVRRVVAMGCSCTGQGVPTYAGYLHERLNAEEPGRWDAFNMGVHGYSTSQGLRLFQNQTVAYRPDFVTVFFGWNDHWRARAEDSRRMARRAAPWQAPLIQALRKKRFFQYIVEQRTPKYENVLDDDTFVLRVPPEEYRLNLRRFADEVRRIGATPIFIAAPRGPTLTPSLVRNRQAASIESALRLHDEYLEILYAVAAEKGVPVVDLPRRLPAERRKEIFSEDGIHFRQTGLAWVAEEIHRVLRDLVPLPPPG